MKHLRIDEGILKSHSIYWFNDEKSPVAIKNDLADYILKLKKEFGKYDKIPEKYVVEIYFLKHIVESNTLTVDILSKASIPLNRVRPEFVPINYIDLR